MVLGMRQALKILNCFSFPSKIGWISWCCFVGMFIVRISKNRTLRQVIVSVFLCPTVYCLLWFSFMGGIGLRQQRQALELEKIGTTNFGDANYFVSNESDFCYNVPQEDVVLNGTTVFHNTLLGITPVCTLNTDNDAQSWFNVSAMQYNTICLFVYLFILLVKHHFPFVLIYYCAWPENNMSHTHPDIHLLFFTDEMKRKLSNLIELYQHVRSCIPFLIRILTILEDLGRSYRVCLS